MQIFMRRGRSLANPQLRAIVSVGLNSLCCSLCFPSSNILEQNKQRSEFKRFALFTWFSSKLLTDEEVGGVGSCVIHHPLRKFDRSFVNFALCFWLRAYACLFKQLLNIGHFIMGCPFVNDPIQCNYLNSATSASFPDQRSHTIDLNLDPRH